MSTDFRTTATDAALQGALDAVGDPVRRSILRQLAAAEPWTIACGQFDLPVGKSTLTHHFKSLVEAGLLEQRDEGNRRMNRLMRDEFDSRFPGLLDLVLDNTSAT
ncbi:helix-turn-helix domain-containing protein [Nocardioides sp. NPDC000445]|uniref:ArsR/SmtB family transcription factor n=1 Tax=Nocardioides sp. NPDC000445 TaxID=3154257 RepID=UPI00331A7044